MWVLQVGSTSLPLVRQNGNQSCMTFESIGVFRDDYEG